MEIERCVGCGAARKFLGSSIDRNSPYKLIPHRIKLFEILRVTFIEAWMRDPLKTILTFRQLCKCWFYGVQITQ